VRGRVRGAPAFAAYAAEASSWLKRHDVVVEDVEHVITQQRGFEEVVLHLDGAAGRIDLPLAIVGEFRTDGKIDELRLYFSNWALAGQHVNRPPLLQPDPQLREPDVVGDYQRALAAGDAQAVVETFEADGYAREPAGGDHVHKGHAALRSFYEQLFSNGGGIPLEHCATIDDGRACALEYNVARWGSTELPPQAGIAVYVRGPDGKLAAARIYDDADPPLDL
jgi:SnoaL-like domain